jgi:hypothetical protein
MATYWGNKKKVRMFFPGEAATVRLSSLVVYAYRTYQDEYGETPSKLKVCHATGLSIAAINSADQQLLEHGLIESDRTVKRPPAEWFGMKRPDTVDKLTQKSTHWRHYYTTWDLFVRDPKAAHGRMTHAQAAIMSYIWHCYGTSYEPHHGWSISYVAKVLKCKWDTAKDALLVLQYLGALHYELQNGESLKLRLRRPTQEILSLFQNAEKQRQFRKRPCSIGMIDAAPATAVPEPLPSLDDIIRSLKRSIPGLGEEIDDLASTLLTQAIAAEDPNQYVLDVWNKLNRTQMSRRHEVLAAALAKGHNLPPPIA